MRYGAMACAVLVAGCFSEPESSDADDDGAATSATNGSSTTSATSSSGPAAETSAGDEAPVTTGVDSTGPDAPGTGDTGVADCAMEIPVQNAGFEMWPAVWQVEEATAAPNDMIPPDSPGMQSLSVDGSNVPADTDWAIGQLLMAPGEPFPPGRYRVEAWVRLDKGEPAAPWFALRSATEPTNVVAAPVMPWVPDEVWHRVSATLVGVPALMAMELRFLNAEAQQVTIDDVVLWHLPPGCEE